MQPRPVKLDLYKKDSSGTTCLYTFAEKGLFEIILANLVPGRAVDFTEVGKNKNGKIVSLLSLLLLAKQYTILVKIFEDHASILPDVLHPDSPYNTEATEDVELNDLFQILKEYFKDDTNRIYAWLIQHETHLRWDITYTSNISSIYVEELKRQLADAIEGKDKKDFNRITSFNFNLLYLGNYWLHQKIGKKYSVDAIQFAAQHPTFLSVDVNFIANLFAREHQHETQTLLTFLLIGQHYKKVDPLLTEEHIRALLGQWNPAIATSAKQDRHGQTPRDYAYSYGYAFSKNAQIFADFNPQDVKQPKASQYNDRIATIIRHDHNLLTDLFNARPDLLTAIDLNRTYNNYNRYVDILCDKGHADLVLKILKTTNSSFPLTAKLKHDKDYSASIPICLIKIAYYNSCEHSEDEGCNCSFLEDTAKDLLYHIIENFQERIDITALMSITAEEVSVGTYLAYRDAELLLKIMRGTHSSGTKCLPCDVIDLSYPTYDGTLLYMLAHEQRFELLKLILKNGNTQIPDITEVGSYMGIQTPLIALIMRAREWELLYLLQKKTASRDYLLTTELLGKSFFGFYASLCNWEILHDLIDGVTSCQIDLDEQLGESNLEELLIQHNQLGLLDKIANKKASTIKPRVTPPVSKKNQINFEEAPSERKLLALAKPTAEQEAQAFENSLQKLKDKYTITSKLDKSNNKFILEFRGNQVVIKKLLEALNNYSKSNITQLPVQAGGIASFKLTTKSMAALHDLFLKNAKFMDAIENLSNISQAAPKSPTLFSNSKAPASKADNINREKWKNALLEIFCYADGVNITNDFKITWQRPLTTWAVRDRNASHSNSISVDISEEFIETQIISRIRSRLVTNNELTCTKTADGFYEFKFLQDEPSHTSVIANMQISIFKALKRNQVVAEAPLAIVLPEAEKTPAPAPPMLTGVKSPVASELNSEKIVKLFKAIAGGVQQNLTFKLHYDKTTSDGQLKWSLECANYSARYFKSLAFAINSYLPSAMRIHMNNDGNTISTITFRCDIKQFDKLESCLAHQQRLFSQAYQDQLQPRQPSAAIASNPLTPSASAATVEKPKLAESDAESANELAREHTIMITSIQCLNFIERQNLEQHLTELLTIKTYLATTTNANDKDILFYAYLIHIVRVFDLLAGKSAGKTVLYDCRNILRHALASKSQEEIYSEMHPFLMALNETLSIIKSGQSEVTLANFFTSIALPPAPIQRLVQSAEPYEKMLLARQLQHTVSSAKKHDQVRHYKALLAAIDTCGLPKEWKDDARLGLNMAIGENANRKVPANQAAIDIYQKVGHEGKNLPWRQFVNNLLRPEKKARPPSP